MKTNWYIDLEIKLCFALSYIVWTKILKRPYEDFLKIVDPVRYEFYMKYKNFFENMNKDIKVESASSFHYREISTHGPNSLS